VILNLANLYYIYPNLVVVVFMSIFKLMIMNINTYILNHQFDHLKNTHLGWREYISFGGPSATLAPLDQLIISQTAEEVN
jgi:hypothetical protein